MNINQLKSVLPIMTRNRIVPFLWGKQGIGKTQVVSQIAQEQDIGFVGLYLGACADVGDILGLLIQDGATVKHARPSWFPTEGSGIIFLDELNRAHPDILQAMFQFVRTGELHTHKLPPGWQIVAAGNYDSEEFTVTSTSDAAWNSRFAHIHVEPTTEEFILYAESKGADKLASYIRGNPEMLEVAQKSRPELNVTPDRRSWLEMIAPLDNETMDDQVRYELYSGIVGTVAAASYKAHQGAKQQRLTLKDIIGGYKKSIRDQVKSISGRADETRFDLLTQPLDELKTHLELDEFYLKDSMIKPLQTYLLDIPKELSHQAIKSLSELRFPGKHDLLGDATFVKKLLKK